MKKPNITMLHTDCMEYMAGLPDKVFDAIITDPPYGIAYQSSRRIDKQKRHKKVINDESPFVEWINDAYRILKDGGRVICFYRWDVQCDFVSAFKSAGFSVVSQIVWDKVSHGMGDLNGSFAPQHELALYCVKGRYEFKNGRPKSVYRARRIPGEKLKHPCEKPLNLMSAIIRDVTEKNETVFDPFAGSFVTAIACHDEERNCVSTELDHDYYNAAVKRYKQHAAQLQMF